MDQIVAQSLTTYGKIMSLKRSQAVVMTRGRSERNTRTDTSPTDFNNEFA